MIALERFRGGGRLMMISAGVGVAGLGLTGLGMAIDPAEATRAYLTAFVFWVGISVGALILLGAFHASKARWMTVGKRALETMAIASPLFILLFIPIALNMKHLFSWLDLSGFKGEELHKLEHKAAYLNGTAFLLRAGLYFAVWVLVSHLLHRWSSLQDEHGDPGLTRKQRALGTGSLPFLALTLTFAAIDWLMSLTPLWASTMFGVYYFAGSFLAAIAVWTLASVWARGENQFGTLITEQHLHNFGKLLLAFVAFWAYIAFSQFMLIWIANLPEENVWYLARIQGAWTKVFAFLIIGHFFGPFFILLSQRLKLRRGFLAGMSLWILFVHFVDMYWLVAPAFHPDAPAVHWTHVTSMVGIGGVALAYTLFRARGGYTVGIKDPYLAESLRYTQP